MIQSTYQTGLQVVTVEPSLNDINTSIYSPIKLTFNSDLNTMSIVDNFVVLEDSKGIYTDSLSIHNNPTLFKSVVGNVTYKDRIVTFTPSEPLKKSTKYVICIKAYGIVDVTGITSLEEQIFFFVTEGGVVDAIPEITEPRYGEVVSSLLTVKWSDVKSTAYVLQISKSQNFETLALEQTLFHDIYSTNIITEYTIPNQLSDGLYFVRVRGISGPWSESIQVFIKSNETQPITQEDLAEFIEQIDGEDIQLLEVFPNENSADIALNIGLFYFKFKGKVNVNDIDFANTFVFGESIEEQGLTDIEGKWNSVYDDITENTYIIYKL